MTLQIILSLPLCLMNINLACGCSSHLYSAHRGHLNPLMRRFLRINGPTKKSSCVPPHYSGSRYVYDVSGISMFAFSHAIFNSTVTFIESSIPIRSTLTFWRRVFYELLGWTLLGRSVIYCIRLLPHEPDSHIAAVDCLTIGASIPFSSVPSHHGYLVICLGLLRIFIDGHASTSALVLFVFSMISSKRTSLAVQVGLYLN